PRDVDDHDGGPFVSNRPQQLLGQLPGPRGVQDADDRQDEKGVTHLEERRASTWGQGGDSSRMAFCCSWMTRSRSSTKLTPTVTAIRLAAGSYESRMRFRRPRSSW